MQEIDVRAIGDLQGGGVMAFLYRGDSSALNEQGEGILESMQLICPSDS